MARQFTPCLTAVLMALCLTGVQGVDCEVETKYLNGTAGDTLTFQTGLWELHKDSHVLWYSKTKTTKKTLINYSGGEMLQAPPKRFHLNKTTGSPTIQPLSINDTGIYHGEMFDKNNKKICYEYHVTVQMPDPTQPPAHHNKVVIGLVAVAVAAVVVGIIIALAVYFKVIKIGKCFCREKNGDSGVV